MLFVHIKNLGEQRFVRGDAQIFFLGGEDQTLGTVFGAAQVFNVGVVQVYLGVGTCLGVVNGQICGI